MNKKQICLIFAAIIASILPMHIKCSEGKGGRARQKTKTSPFTTDPRVFTQLSPHDTHPAFRNTVPLEELLLMTQARIPRTPHKNPKYNFNKPPAAPLVTQTESPQLFPEEDEAANQLFAEN